MNYINLNKLWTIYNSHDAMKEPPTIVCNVQIFLKVSHLFSVLLDCKLFSKSLETKEL